MNSNTLQRCYRGKNFILLWKRSAQVKRRFKRFKVSNHNFVIRFQINVISLTGREGFRKVFLGTDKKDLWPCNQRVELWWEERSRPEAGLVTVSVADSPKHHTRLGMRTRERDRFKNREKRTNKCLKKNPIYDTPLKSSQTHDFTQRKHPSGIHLDSNICTCNS